MRKFEVITEYQNQNISLPQRSTKLSAGYDLIAAETILIPSYIKQLYHYKYDLINKYSNVTYDLSVSAAVIKSFHFKPTLVPTGLKIKLNPNEEMEIRSRSSIATKNLLMLANSVGTIDADYYNNKDNEGHIMVPLINLSPFDIIIKKGDKIAQALIKQYLTIDNEDEIYNERNGGFGSTGIGDK